MKEDPSLNDILSSQGKDSPEKSFSVAFEQMAQFLRSQVKMSDRKTHVISSHTLSQSFNHALRKIVKLLRSEANTLSPIKKHVWKHHSKKVKKKE